MNSAHVHLILNHLPLAGMLFSIPLLAIAWWRKSEEVGVIGLVSVVISGFLTIPTYLTGEPAEELIERLEGVSERLIKIHEEAAERAIWLIGMTSVFALVGLILRYKKKFIPGGVVVAVLLLALICVGGLAWTNNLGGEIRHTEIRKIMGQIYSPNAEKNEKNED